MLVSLTCWWHFWTGNNTSIHFHKIIYWSISWRHHTFSHVFPSLLYLFCPTNNHWKWNTIISTSIYAIFVCSQGKSLNIIDHHLLGNKQSQKNVRFFMFFPLFWWGFFEKQIGHFRWEKIHRSGHHGENLWFFFRWEKSTEGHPTLPGGVDAGLHRRHLRSRQRHGQGVLGAWLWSQSSSVTVTWGGPHEISMGLMGFMWVWINTYTYHF